MSLRMSSHFLDEHHRDEEDHDRHSSSEGSSSSEEDEADLTWEDWVSDSASKRPCKSLFEEKMLGSVAEMVEWDKANHGFDFDAICKQRCTSPLFRIM